ncbi:MAG: signal peptidase I [Bacteroidota bacterium]|nr:signal peptidase I [Bacteroidota bacterium]
MRNIPSRIPRKALHWTGGIFVSILLALFIKIFLIEIYKVPSQSMMPTLIPGDFIVVSKINYGARLLKIDKLIKQKEIDYLRAGSFQKINRNDLVVFNWPGYYTLYTSAPNMYGECIVKRCCGIPGDTVIIKDDEINAEIEINPSKKLDLFPHDSTIHWTINDFGPLFVPGKGKTINLSAQNAIIYKDVIKYEGYNITIRNDSAFLNNRYSTHFTFTTNYYFMKGDNFYGSQDSRYWGFVPEKNIIGRVALILFSNGNYGWQWNRLFKSIPVTSN